ncbi:MAG: DNA methyltransferase [Patescibacteria group bacterium]|jgi:tRNA G10  N-methylase Trm11
MQYVFILGHNPKLSAAEILAVLPHAKVVAETSTFLILENEEIDCQKILARLGGTIKIGTIIGSQISKKVTIEKLKQIKAENKLNFGISYYDAKPDNFGMEIKKELKDAGISCRLVVSRDKALSSVVVTKNKCHEFLILGNKWLGETGAVQEFEDYSFRDYGRPSRDLVAGSMPPKLAKIMINLAQLPVGETILDPFCGSGTMLQEGLLLGYKMIGSDIAEKAIKDTKKNLEWLLENREQRAENREQRTENRKQKTENPPLRRAGRNQFQVFQVDVKNVSSKVSNVDAIVTEPHLGPPLRGSEDRHEVEKNIKGLAELYIEAFSEFRKILNNGGKVVMIFPSFRVGSQILEMPILDQIKKLGFSQVNADKLIYSREGQKVWRQIYIFKRQF